jgi:hypothetical protein
MAGRNLDVDPRTATEDDEELSIGEVDLALAFGTRNLLLKPSKTHPSARIRLEEGRENTDIL